MDWAFTKPREFLAIPSLAYLTCNRPVMGKQHYDVKSHNKPDIISQLPLNLQKHISKVVIASIK